MDEQIELDEDDEVLGEEDGAWEDFSDDAGEEARGILSINTMLHIYLLFIYYFCLHTFICF